MNNDFELLVGSFNKNSLRITGMLACVLLIVLGCAIQFRGLTQFETSVLWSVYQWHTPVLDQLCYALAYLGSMPALLTALAMLCIGCAIYRKFVMIYFITSAGVGIIALGWLLKFMVARSRPDVWQQAVAHYGASFPSNHSAYALLLAGLVSLLAYGTRWQTPVVVASILWTILMGLSRIYIGAHFPTDVLAGWSLAVAWLCLLLSVFKSFNFFNHRASYPAGNHEVK